MLISPASHRAVGASTAVFAALGLLVGFAWRHGLTLRDRFKYAYGPVFGGVALLALLGAGDQHVDVLAHALGFVAGVATGWLYSRLGVPRSRGQEAGRLLEVTTLPIDSQGRQRAKAKQETPDQVVRHVGRKQGGGEKRPKNETGSLHGKDKCHEHATGGFAGVFAHDGGRHRIISADADAQNEAQSDEPPDVR